MADPLNIQYPTLSSQEILEIYNKMGIPVSESQITPQFQDNINAIVHEYKQRGGTFEFDCPF